MSETVTAAEKKLSSFDVLASVNLMRHDLDNYGQVLPETLERVYDEELTYIAEGINQPLMTEFRLGRVGDELAYFHNGQWRPYLGSLVTAVEVYRLESLEDPRKKFMYDRAVDDLRIGYQLADLNPGEKLRWKSAFPDHELVRYGDDFIGELGFQAERRMGFLYEAETDNEGYLLLRTYSVDNSDDEAFAAALESDDMLEGYDTALGQKYGGSFAAGRRPGSELREENAWDTVRSHKDLIEDYFMKELERLALSGLPRAELEKAKKRLTYGVWAALRKRLEEGVLIGTDFTEPHGGYDSVGGEVQRAYHEASVRGEVLFGCGGSMTGEAALLNAAAKDVFDDIFGSKYQKMSCHFCGATQYGDPCASSQYCPDCTARVRDGRVVSKGKARRPPKGVLDIFMEEFGRWNQQYQLEQERKKAAARLRIEDATKILD